MILGLALGILSSFLLLTYVFNELSYDRYLPDSNRVYRITSDYHGNWGTQQVARCYDDWIDQFKGECPEVVEMVKFFNPFLASITINGNKFKPGNFLEADSTFFQVFPFKFMRGNSAAALQSPFSMVIAQSIARRYFGSGNPIGKRVEVIDENSNSFEYHVTGVIEDVPANSHFHADFIAGWIAPYEREGRGYYYFTAIQGASQKELRVKLDEFVLKHASKDEASRLSFHLQALTDIHLKSHLNRELDVNGNITQVYVLSIMAVLIMIITCINYINLSIARKTASTKELGVRRVLGAGTAAMFLQNIAESFTYVLVSLFIVVLLFEPSLAMLEGYLNFRIGIDVPENMPLALFFFGEVLLLGVVSGGYPTLALRRASSVGILSISHNYAGNLNAGARGLFSRRALLVVQFSLAILLISAVIIVVQQMNYVESINMGYDPEQIVVIPHVPDTVKERYPVLKKELEKESGVLGITTSLEVPSDEIVDKARAAVEGKWDFAHAPFCDLLPVDRDFVNVMKMTLVAGDSFDKYILADAARPHSFKSRQDIDTYLNCDRVYMINEAAVKTLGWKSPQEAIGKRIALSWAFQLKLGPIVGVVKDFHFTSLHRKIEQIVMFVEPLWYNNILIRVNANGIDKTLASIRQIWNRIIPEYQFDYEFANDAYAAKYIVDNQFKAAMGIFSSIAIVVACIGLFSVSLFNAERRRKEIGIRKVVGASVLEIAIMLTKDLARWIILANLFAWPLAYYGMTKWLQNFAYHTDITIWPFVLAGMLTLTVAMLTVSWQAVRAAMASPVESLRYE